MGQMLDQRLPNTVIRRIGVALVQLAVPAPQSFSQTWPFSAGQAAAQSLIETRRPLQQQAKTGVRLYHHFIGRRLAP
ncbi:hypothetical protein D3C76_1806000 [compost metagenome]